MSDEAAVCPAGRSPITFFSALILPSLIDRAAYQAIKNMLAVLAAAGGAPERLARVTVYIVGIENWACFNAVYASMIPDTRPARTVVPVPELHHGFLVEIDAIAFLHES